MGFWPPPPPPPGPTTLLLNDESSPHLGSWCPGPTLELDQKLLEGRDACSESAFLASSPGDSDKHAKWSTPLVGEPYLNHILKKVNFSFVSLHPFPTHGGLLSPCSCQPLLGAAHLWSPPPSPACLHHSGCPPSPDEVDTELPFTTTPSKATTT